MTTSSGPTPTGPRLRVPRLIHRAMAGGRAWIGSWSWLGLSVPRVAWLLVLAMVSAIFEGVGVAMFVPIFEYVERGETLDVLLRASAFWVHVAAVYDWLRVPINLATLLGSAFCLFVLRQLLTYARVCKTVALQQQVTHSLQVEGFRRILKADLAYVHELGVGRAMNLLTVEMQRTGYAVSAFVAFVSSLLVVFVYAGLLARVSVGMTLSSAVLIVAVSLLMRGWMRRSKSIGDAITEQNSELGAVLAERLAGARLVKLCGTEAQEITRIAHLSYHLKSLMTKCVTLGARMEAVLEPVVVFVALGLIYVALEVFHLELAKLGLFLFVTIRLLPLIKELPKTRQSMMGLRGSFTKVQELLEASANANHIKGGTQQVPARCPDIRFEHVTFTYPGSQDPAVRQVTLTIPAGKMTALVGRSGAGKSTLINLLARLYVSQSGAIFWDGIPIEEFDLAALRRGIAFVSQEAVIFNESAAENIRYGTPTGTMAETIEAARVAQADQFITALPDGYETRLGERGIRLSGGERQRIALARAVLQRAPVLVLDEPVSAVDYETERGIQQGLRALRDEGRTTIIVIAHRASTIQSADHLVLLDKGGVVAEGSHEQLLEGDGWYAQMVGTESEISGRATG